MIHTDWYQNFLKSTSSNRLDCFSQEDELKNGGAALMAYARMQFEVMSDYEREELKRALLKYCELWLQGSCLVLL